MSSQMKAREFSGRDMSSIRDQASQVVKLANTITEITREVADGATSQVRTLGNAVTSTDQLLASLRETAERTSNIVVSAEETSSAIVESSTSIEQDTGNAVSLAS